MADALQISEEELIITTQELRTCRYCSKGARQIFLERGYDWRRFVRYGLPWAVFVNRDELENALYRTALERVNGNGECEEHAAKGYDKADLFSRT